MTYTYNSSIIYMMILIVQERYNKKGTLFSARNITTKGVRQWSCRLGVTKHLKGGPVAYDAESRNFITVWDPNAKGRSKYRQLNCATLTHLRVAKQYLIKNGNPTELYNELKDTAKAMVRLRKEGLDLDD